MKFIKKTILIITVLLIGLFLSTANISAEPVASISVVPEEPEPLDTLTFTATVTSDEDIDEINLIIKECKPTLCYKRTIVPMTLNEDTYQAEFELEYSDATYISYHLEITSTSTTYETEEVNLTLKIDSSNENGNGDDGGNDEDNNNGSPGFEIFAFIVAVFIAFFLIRRKR